MKISYDPDADAAYIDLTSEPLMPGRDTIPCETPEGTAGHSRLAVTLEIYTHEDRQGQKDALGKISDELQDEAGQADDGEIGA